MIVQLEKGKAMSKPLLNAFAVTEYESNGKQKTFWRQIGVAFAHKTGDGLEVRLDALPVNGRIVLLPPKEGERGEEADS